MDSTDAPLSDGPVTSTVEISNNVEWREQVREQVTDSTTDQIAFENPHIKVRGYTELRKPPEVQTILKHPKKSAESHLDGKTPTSFWKLIRKKYYWYGIHRCKCIVFETEDNPISPTT